MIIVFDAATGRIEKTVSAPNDHLEFYGPNALITEEAVLDTTHYVQSGALVTFPERPSSAYEWDWSTLAWTLSADCLRAYKIEEVNLSEAYHIGRAYDNILLAPETREQLSSLFIRLLAGLGLPPAWRGILDADGNYQLAGATTAQIKAELGLILTGSQDRAYAARANAEDLRAALTAALTVSDLNAIDISLGWPA